MTLRIFLAVFLFCPTCLPAEEKPLPKKVEFELSLWESRLGLQKRHMRELRFAASNAVAELEKVKKEAEGKELDEDPWEAHKTESEVWAGIRLPRALKAKSFTEVAEKVLGDQHLTNLRRLKKHARELRKNAERMSLIHARVANLTRILTLTESQQKQITELLQKRSATRRQMLEKFKGREDEMPTPKPFRQDPEFLAILDESQKKRLKPTAEVDNPEL